MRGIYEKPVGSSIWWINYFAAGKRHREKVGRKSDAIKLYLRPLASSSICLPCPNTHANLLFQEFWIVGRQPGLNSLLQALSS